MLVSCWGLLGVVGIALGAFSALRSPLSALNTLHSLLLNSPSTSSIQTKRCPKGHLNSADRKFCKECGAKLPEMPAKISVLLCPKTKLKAGKYCPTGSRKLFAASSVPQVCTFHKPTPTYPAVTRLTNFSAIDDNPSWGPDGRIAFESHRDGLPEIYIMNADGSDQTRLTNNDASDHDPSVGPDGRIVFVSNRDGDWDIYVMNGDGSNQTRLTYNSENDFNPNWGQDGRITFVSKVGEGFELFMVEPSLNNRITQLTHCSAHFGELSICKDGRIVFVENWAYNNEICVMDGDGTDIKRLTNNSFPDNSPTSNSDGRIAFTSHRDGNGEIYIMSSDGSKQLRLTNNPENEWKPAWGPDGRIAFVSNRDGNAEIYLMKAPPK